MLVDFSPVLAGFSAVLAENMTRLLIVRIVGDGCDGVVDGARQFGCPEAPVLGFGVGRISPL